VRIWVAPMARVRLGLLERKCMRSRQGAGPCFQASASLAGWMMAMTPSPIRAMAAKCWKRLGERSMGWLEALGDRFVATRQAGDWAEFKAA